MLARLARLQHNNLLRSTCWCSPHDRSEAEKVGCVLGCVLRWASGYSTWIFDIWYDISHNVTMTYWDILAVLYSWKILYNTGQLEPAIYCWKGQSSRPSDLIKELFKFFSERPVSDNKCGIWEEVRLWRLQFNTSHDNYYPQSSDHTTLPLRKCLA